MKLLTVGNLRAAHFQPRSPPGTSPIPTSPRLLHPTRNSHVRAFDTAGGSAAGGIRVLHPSNHRPDDAASTRDRGSMRNPSFAACRRALSRTYAIAFLTSRGVRSTCRWKRSASTAPRRPKTRFTARASRAPTDFIPHARSRALAASTIRCT